MSFQLFIYYCALCGGWAAFLTWGLVQIVGIDRFSSLPLRASIIGGMLGALVAAGVGLVDARLNAVGSQRILRIGVCAAVGLVGGAVGGLLGQLLNSYLYIPVFVGWIFVGVLIGASIGAFDILQAYLSGQNSRASFAKLRNGIYGGLIGGLIGGLPYTFLLTPPEFLRPLAQAFPRTVLTVSLVLLGVSIGLMIGLAQVILKEAWITVEEGFRAGREQLLTKDETTIGRSEASDLGLFGDNTIQKTHARILLQNNRYLLAHAAESGETFINDTPVGDKPMVLRDGDIIRIGKCVLRFGERQKRK